MTVRLVLIIEGGIVQEAFADDPNELEVVIVDHDVEGVDESSITIINEETQSGAVIGQLPVAPARELDGSVADAVVRALEA